VYDKTNPDTFIEAENLILSLVTKGLWCVSIILVGNKFDLCTGNNSDSNSVSESEERK
jgi:hypothetical protein